MKMIISSHKKILSIIIVASILLFVTVKNIQNDIRTSISMKEAYQIAYEAVRKENPQVLLYSIGSADSMYQTEDKTAGANGLRRYWNVIFAVPNSTTEQWVVFIRDRTVKDIIKITGPSMSKSDLIWEFNSLINTKTALKIAKDEYHLQPGEGWAIGYHYRLDKTSGINIIHVIGRDNSNNFARVFINAKTKQIIDAIHKVSHDGTTYQWEQFEKPN